MDDKTRIQEMIAVASRAREFSYAPYSNFTVGAALMTKNGKVYTGCNVESVSYSPTTCAERVAILKAVSEGERSFEMIVVIGGPREGESKAKGYSGPCGVCRQMIYEFGKDTKVIIANSLDEYYVHDISELFPFGFGPDHLLG
ncbi:cytidine deaminase [Serratia proteamaculans]|uniref:cytidine deaminase n=1 Tax=Serratia proteamaculans TaxID=28151 RepID=UPI0021771AB0|nr:cytidine deaminase [Serratia proteamaculans]CAI1940334.1 Cytidine deaminase [Serratia proteamaculans]